VKIYIAADHTGFELKKVLISHLESRGHEVEDCGAYELDPTDDYPDFIYPCAKKVGENPGTFGILIGGSGQGEAFCANKARGVRAVLFYGSVTPKSAVDVTGRVSDDPLEIVRLTREHNNANVLSLGVRFLSVDAVKEAVDLWLATKFETNSRHQRRLEKIAKIEEKSTAIAR